MADLLIVRLQALDDTRDAKVIVPLGAVQCPERKTQLQTLTVILSESVL